MLFYKQHFYKQHQAQIGKQNKQNLSNTWRLNFCYFKYDYFFDPRFYF